MRTSVYSIAVSRGYPYVRGTGQEVNGVWCSRFTKTSDGTGPALLVGFDKSGQPLICYDSDGLVWSA